MSKVFLGMSMAFFFVSLFFYLSWPKYELVVSETHGVMRINTVTGYVEQYRNMNWHKK